MTMDDDLVQRIDDEAKKQGVSRAGWIVQASHQVLEASGADDGAIATLRVKCDYQQELIHHLTEDKTWLQGEVARLQAHNELMLSKMPQLPAPSQGGFWSRLSHRLRGDGD